MTHIPEHFKTKYIRTVPSADEDVEKPVTPASVGVI